MFVTWTGLIIGTVIAFLLGDYLIRQDYRKTGMLCYFVGVLYCFYMLTLIWEG